MSRQPEESWVRSWSKENGLGIEWELGVVDVDHLGLVEGGGTDLIDAVRRIDTTAEGWLHDELYSHTVECVTPPSGTVRDAVDFLGDRVRLLRSVAARQHRRLFSAGSHPFSKAQDYSLTEDSRREARVARIGRGPNDMQIWSVHIHVGVTSPEAAVAAMRELHAHTPYFMAFTGSSPFWEGEDTGLLASRPAVYVGRPFRGPAPLFESWEQYQKTAQSLQLAKRISHPKDLHWEVRITPHGTVELRVCDGLASLKEIGAVAALAQCLVARAEENVRQGKPLTEVDEVMFDGNRRMAMRYGMGARFVTPDGDMRRLRERLPGLVEDLKPFAERLGCAEELAHCCEMSAQYTADERSAPAGARQRTAAVQGRSLQAAVRQSAGELDRSLLQHRSLAAASMEHPGVA